MRAGVAMTCPGVQSVEAFLRNSKHQQDAADVVGSADLVC